ncbi:MAG TPA: cupin domain-containing protein [Haliscomenobacter sp.]|nr:cupin domain-containing protein [Haliscomenobacter sp.]
MNQHPAFEQQFILDAEIPWETIEPGVRRKVLSFDERVMMVKVSFDTGGIGALHHHHHTQISYVAQGVFEISIGGTKKTLRQGDGYYIPPNEIHGARCLEAGELVDVFTPIREDFIAS